MDDRVLIPTRSAIAAPLERLMKFVEKGGPQPIEYDELSTLFDEIAIRRTEGDLESIIAFAQDSKGAFNSTQTNQGFVCIRPHGYHGDFEIIDRIYTNWVSPDPTLERWDHFFQRSSAAKAVRARKEYCHALLRDIANCRPSGAQVLNVASGPGRDIFEFFIKHADLAHRLRIHFVEQDSKAIEHASKLLTPFHSQITLDHNNILRWRTNQRFNLIWCAGLFDYLTDALFVRLLRKLAGMVYPGGELVVGNFSNRNVHRNYMEFGGWHLFHRDSAKLMLLFERACIADASARIGEEPNGVNLFLHIRKHHL